MYTDIHTHVIWGVDDGAESEEQTEAMLRSAVQDGIGRIIATPHMTPGVEPFPEDVFEAHFRAAEDLIRREHLPLELSRGAEILYTDFTPRLLREGRVPTLAGSPYVLVEFSPTDTLSHIQDALRKISGTGYLPVVAHVERYPAIRKAAELREMKDRFQALIQVNARTLLRKQPLLRRKYFDSLFETGLVDFVASDVHAMPGRETCLRDGMQALETRYGRSAAERVSRAPDLVWPSGT